MVTAVNAGGQSALSGSATTYTLAAIPGQPAPSSVSYTSFTVTWSANQNPAGTRYEVSFSTDSAFVHSQSRRRSRSARPSPATRLPLFNLIPATTYYFRVRAANGDGFLTAFSTTNSTATLTVPPPTGLTGTALSVSTISWTWNPVADAQSYNVYPASNPVSPIGNVLSPAWIETGLSTNTAYGLQVTAIISGVESVLSPATTRYTLAAVPTVPVPSVVGYSSFTTSPGPVITNPGTTPFEVSISSVSSFANSVSTPIALTDGFTSLTTNFVNLLSGTTYLLPYPRGQRRCDSRRPLALWDPLRR